MVKLLSFCVIVILLILSNLSAAAAGSIYPFDDSVERSKESANIALIVSGIFSLLTLIVIIVGMIG